MVERLLVVDTMAVLALPIPAVAGTATAWFSELAADTTAAPGTRLAAAVERVVPRPLRRRALGYRRRNRDLARLDTLLLAWTQNPATANHVVACLDRMGPATEPALPHIRTQLALPERGGRFSTIDNDQELQRISRTIIARFG
ncbi:hypothetical protein [Yinghuangia sp. YIM S10712]|uniref:hypothetical protein n=1 Tax=Yinghuangia sp. YIM S10712 TaxID=3436930 RepID=UPI003F533E3C